MFPYKPIIMNFCYKFTCKKLSVKPPITSDSIKLSLRGLFQIPYDKELEFFDEEGNKLILGSSLHKKKIYVEIKGESSGSIKKKLRLKIRVSHNEGTIINVEPSDTIENIKKNIFNNIFIMPEKLFLGSGVQLEDNKTINDYGIKDEDVLYMPVKKRVGK